MRAQPTTTTTSTTRNEFLWAFFSPLLLYVYLNCYFVVVFILFCLLDSFRNKTNKLIRIEKEMGDMGGMDEYSNLTLHIEGLFYSFIGKNKIRLFFVQCQLREGTNRMVREFLR